MTIQMQPAAFESIGAPSQIRKTAHRQISHPVAASGWRETLRADLRAYGMQRTNLLWAGLYFFTVPGFLTVVLYRLSAACVKKGIWGKACARILRRLNMFVSSCDIAPTAVIGSGFYMPHPVAIVIGEGVVIGQNATIYQSVTLGLRHVAAKGEYPSLGNNVIVYVGAVLCGSIRVGDNAVIGANAVAMQDIPENAKAVGSPARIL